MKAIDGITSHSVSERANGSLVSISPRLTTHCIIYIEVQSYFIWCWQLFLELWVKCRHERVSRSRVRLCVHVCECPSLLSIHAHTSSSSTEYDSLRAAHFAGVQVHCPVEFCSFCPSDEIWHNKHNLFGQMLHVIINGRNRKWHNSNSLIQR